MNLNDATNILRMAKAQTGDLVAAYIVMMVHARAAYDAGDTQLAKELARVAETGLWALGRMLTAKIAKQGWHFIRDGYETAEEVSSQVQAKIWVHFMRGDATPPDGVEARPPAQLVAWVNAITYNFCVDKDNYYAEDDPDGGDGAPVGPTRVPPSAPIPPGTLSAELQAEMASILTRTLDAINNYTKQRATVLGGKIDVSEFVGLLLNYSVGEHGLVDDILSKIGGPNPPTREAVRQAAREVRSDLAGVLAELKQEWHAWQVRAGREGDRILAAFKHEAMTGPNE